jgi:hypothetical protein
VTDKGPPPIPAHVAAVFSAFPERVRARLFELRTLIFETAAGIEGVSPLTETLKWGEPAYLTEATGSGSTIRLGWFRTSERECAVLFNCRTTLVDNFATSFLTHSPMRRTGPFLSTLANRTRRLPCRLV